MRESLGAVTLGCGAPALLPFPGLRFCAPRQLGRSERGCGRSVYSRRSGGSGEGRGRWGGVGKGRALEAERTDARGEGAAEGAAGAAGAGRGVAARAADGRGDGMRPPSLPSCRPRLRRRD